MPDGKLSSLREIKPKNSGIVFFDGVCGICNYFVDFLLIRDKHHMMQFAPLQGSTASKELVGRDLDNISTIIYKEGDLVYTESTAALRAISNLGGIWRSILCLLIIPAFIRNMVYRFIARNRYKWFGKKDECRIPTPDEKDRILL